MMSFFFLFTWFLFLFFLFSLQIDWVLTINLFVLGFVGH